MDAFPAQEPQNCPECCFLVTEDYPLYDKFAKLSRQETTWGLLENLREMRRYDRWQQRLAEQCIELHEHRIVWKKDADPYQLKLLKAQVRARQEKQRS